MFHSDSKMFNSLLSYNAVGLIYTIYIYKFILNSPIGGITLVKTRYDSQYATIVSDRDLK